MTKNVEAVRQVRDVAIEKVAELELVKAEKAAINASARKDDKVEAARDAAAARAALTAAKRELSELEKNLKAAEKDAEKEAKAEAARVAMEERAERMRVRQELAESNPLLAFEVNYSALGAWVAQKAKGRACFTEGAGWGEWTGTHWQFSRKPSAELLDRVRRLYATEDGDVAGKLNSNAKSAENILEHAKGSMTVPREWFNRFEVAHLVAFKNVTVDLRTGDTMPHEPEHYMTGALQCDFDENADLDRILRTFARFWPGDDDTAKMFQVALGYSLTGEVAAKRSFFMVGDQDNGDKNGDNGKSLVQNAVMKLLGGGRGGWAVSVKPGLIIDTGDRDANSHDGAKTPLIWRRFAMASEPRKGASIESGEFNRLSGGDVQSARPPHSEESIQFVNTASLWISLNDMIRFKAFNRATRVRLTPFPFKESFHDPGEAPKGCQEKEIGLKDWLESEEGQKALGLYVVRGAMKYYECNNGKAGNFPDSPRVAQERDNILAAANPFNEMFDDWLVFSPLADTTQAALNKLLELHLGARPKEWERNAFYEALKGRNVVYKKVKGTRYWRGVGLTAAGRAKAQQFGNTHPDTWRKAGGDVHKIAAE
ncbi:hypothetical protein [Sulfitobacter sp.]|uniref:hypothetical protein n=1 Tax=Sulfitobacter sp. TaxID=1903071 RepID=UPI00272D1509|nr:hypothetical protein [Sulfitobacter sp.]